MVGTSNFPEMAIENIFMFKTSFGFPGKSWISWLTNGDQWLTMVFD